MSIFDILSNKAPKIDSIGDNKEWTKYQKKLFLKKLGLGMIIIPVVSVIIAIMIEDFWMGIFGLGLLTAIGGAIILAAIAGE